MEQEVAIIGIGCTKFGKRHDAGIDDLIVEAVYEACGDAGLETTDIQAAWIGYINSNSGGVPLGYAIKSQRFQIPITRVENACASGLEALKGAYIGIVSGAYDITLALGFEKSTDTEYYADFPPYPEGLGLHPVIGWPNSLAGAFALIATAYFAKYGGGKEILAKIAVKNRYNGSLCPRAYIRREITEKEVMAAPIIAWPLGLLDCCPVTDGAAAAILCRRELAPKFRVDSIRIRGLSVATSPIKPQFGPNFDFTKLPVSRQAISSAYQRAGIKEPCKEIDVAMIQDSTTITELISYEDLNFCGEGESARLLAEEITNLKGRLPVNTDGGTLSFGHAVGATGLRMIYEVCKQLQGKAEKERLVKNVNTGLCHIVGGEQLNVAATAILSVF